MIQIAGEHHTEAESAFAIRVVLGVARLGEADLAGWWSSHGLNPGVRFALAEFRRTGSIVGGELALLSAVRRHHQLLPRLNAVHLFSPALPFVGWARAHVAELKSVGNSDLLDELRTWTTTRQATEQLSAWIGAGAETSRRVVVSRAELATGTVRGGLLVQLAAGYIDQTVELSIPYVDLSS